MMRRAALALWAKKLGYIFLGYLFIVGGLTLEQRNLIYLPQAQAPVLAAENLPGFQEVQFNTATGLPRTVWHAPAIGGKATVVIYHGNAGNLAQRANLARYLHSAGYGVLLTSYRGYPPNSGQPSEAALFADALADWQWLNQQQQVNHSALVILGSSLGSGPATFLAHHLATTGQPAKALILEVPFDSLANAAQHHYWYVPVRWLLWDQFNNAARIAAINTPLLILAAANDEIVPNQLAKNLYAAASQPKELVVIDNATHNDVLDRNADNFKLVLNFLDNLP